MKTTQFTIIGLVLFLFMSCATNPFSEGKSLALVPSSQLLPMAFKQYDHFLKNHKVIENTKEARMVETVGKQIADAADKWLNHMGYDNYLKNFRWEYNLIDSDKVNAFCMPGGKIVVFQGIMPIAEDKAGLAAILGHEVAHALARHGQQRMSRAMLKSGIGKLSGALLFEDKESRKIFSMAYGLGSKLGVMLPYSRSEETEADKIGVKLMAIAGYAPIEAAHLWQRMSERGGARPPQFLSTHPAPKTRVQNIKSWVDDVKAVAQKFGVTHFQH